MLPSCRAPLAPGRELYWEHVTGSEMIEGVRVVRRLRRPGRGDVVQREWSTAGLLQASTSAVRIPRSVAVR